jgi:hypothetical protein
MTGCVATGGVTTGGVTTGGVTPEGVAYASRSREKVECFSA